MTDCIFCKIDKGEIPSKKVFEDEGLFVIKDVNPQAPTHLLIIPKRHIPTLLDLEEQDREVMSQVPELAGKLARENGFDKSGFRLVVNCGAGAGQSVFHIHFHLLAGRAMQWPPG
ncbi:MAG: histidine triad nucleotide-binding protein [Candidatus Nitronauta litoralis]|uniref:Histidine triad nucleotide-binding protein n=1 Tax=Candidatus Nitronauta litoralis TaxID=2705533 RepID=A0A7T0BTW9_9BACT|nr:MAG: histidine triad nucleotide-binding protein [Candidatus Nitronauta litoralis]